MRFKFLFLKELKQEQLWFTIGLSALVGFELILLLFSGRWPKHCLVISGLSLIIIPVCVLYNIVHSHTTEWARNTSQYLFSLPIRGWHIFGAKFAVQSLIFGIFSFIAFFAIYFIAKIRVHETLGIIPIEVIKFWLISILFILPAMPFGAFPYITSKGFIRLQRLIIFLVSVGMFFGFFEWLLPLGFKLFSFLPEATITTIGVEGIESSGSANFFPGLAMWIFWGLLLLLGNCLILDRWTET